MMRRAALLLAVVLAPACRTYDYHDRVSGNDGLTPGDQFARYGREQAQAVAIARQFAAEGRGSSPEEQARRTEAAMAYARNQPDVTGVVADSQGNFLTLQFRSGWRTAVTPLADGTDAAATPGLQAAPAAAPAQP
jgi:hypothetical protein